MAIATSLLGILPCAQLRKPLAWAGESCRTRGLLSMSLRKTYLATYLRLDRSVHASREVMTRVGSELYVLLGNATLQPVIIALTQHVPYSCTCCSVAPL